MNRIMMLNRVRRIVVEQVRQRSWNLKPRSRVQPMTRAEREEQQKFNLERMFDEAAYHDRDFDYTDHLGEFRTRKALGQSYKKPKGKVFDRQKLHFHDTDKYNAVFDDNFIDEYKPRSQSQKNRDESADDKRRSKKGSYSMIEVVPEEKVKLALDEHQRKVAKMQSRKLMPLPYNITPENRFEILNQALTPLHSVPYEKQMNYKYRKNKQILQMLGEKLKTSESPLQLQRSGLACPLEPVVQSPRIEEYRNKDEFNVWPGFDGNTKTVGFHVGQPSRNEQVICVEPDHVSITKKRHIELAKMFQDYLRTKSKLDYCHNYGFEGHWRRMIVRSNESGETMLVVNMHPQQLSLAEIHQEMEQVKENFQNSATSLYFSYSKNIRSTHANLPEVIHHLSGSETITEKIFNNKFVISPNSFFQVNTLGAEKLYKTVIDQLRPHKNDIVLDFCCGTGILSTLLSEFCHQVIGIDSSPFSIRDAKLNAEMNGKTNVQFIWSRVEDILPKLDSHFEPGKRVIAVMNPSRRGVTPWAMKAIREMEAIKKVVYVSCKPEAEAMDNFHKLCHKTVNKDLSRFVPINAVPVDLFPHTEHCELILTFERF